MRATVYHSWKDAKKFAVVLENQDEGVRQRTIHFGQNGAPDFTITRDTHQRERYLIRHSRNEDWNDPYTAGFWSRWLLWNLPTLRGSARDIGKRFGLKVRLSEDI